MTSVASSQSNPFVGPRSFRTGEVLYGRDRETRKLVNLLIAERIVLLHAPSGAGKTSLIQAAVVPQMRERGFEVFPTIRLNAVSPPAPQGATKMLPAANRYVWSALLALEEQHERAERFAPDELATLSLNAYLDRRLADADSDVVLVFDQFEEVLTLDPINREVKLAFFRQLGEALEDRRRWALFAIRGDRLSELEPYTRPIPTQFSTRFPLELLGLRAAREAIQRPVEEQGIHFTASAAERLIADLSRVRVQRPDGTSEDLPGDVVEPVQLQVVCYRLWERIAPGASEIGESDSTAVGDVDAALGHYYSERVAAIAEATGIAERTIRDWCEGQLITEQDMRGQVLHGKDDSSGLGNAAIQGLVDTHLVRADVRRGAVWYELAHDRLIAPIRKNNAVWREEHLSALQRQAINWQRQGKIPELLLQGGALAEAEQWAAANPGQLALLDSELLDESVQAQVAATQQRQAQRNRAIAIAATTLGLIVLVALVVSLYFFFLAQEQAHRAQIEARQAEAARTTARLTAQAVSSFETQPQLGLLLAVEAANATSAETQTVTTNASSASAVSSTSTITDTAQREVFRQGLKIIGGEPLGSLGHAVSAIAYSPDGRLIAAAGGPTVLLWDRFSPATAPRTIAYAGGGTTALAFSPDGHWFTAAYTDGLVRLWPIRADDQLGTEQALHGHTDRVNALAFHPQSTWLATASSDHTVRLWDLRSQDSSPSSQQTLQHDNAIWSIIFSADGRQLLDGSASVRIWDFGGAGPVGTPRMLHTGGIVYQLALSPDGRWLAAGLDNYGLKFWDLTQPDPQDLKINGSEWVTVPRFSPDGRWLVLPGPSTFVRDLTNGDVATQKPDVLPAVAFIGSASTFSPDGRWLVTAGDDRIMRVWNMRNLFEPARLLRGNEAGVVAVAFSPDGEHLVSANETGAVREWEVPFFAADPEVLSGPAQSQGVHTWQIAPGERPRPQHLLSSEGTYYGISVSRDGRWVAVLNSDGTDLRIWNLQHPFGGAIALSGTYWAMPIFDSQGRYLIGGDTSGKVRLWSLAEGKVGTIIADWQAHDNGPVRDLDISADGQRLATAGHGDGRVKVWFLGGSLPPAQSVTLEAGGGRTYTIRTVAISPDGKHVISGTWEDDFAARIWDLSAPSLPPVELQFTNRVFDVAISPDGRWAAAASWDNRVGLFDLQNLTQKPTLLTGFRARVLTLDFSPDGRWLATGSEDHAVRLWDLRLNDLSIPQVVIEGPYKIGFVQFSPDGRWLLTEVGEYQSTHFDASGRVLVTGYEETRLYHMDEAELRVLACRAAGRNLTAAEWHRYISEDQGATSRQTCPVTTNAGGTSGVDQREATETALRRAFTLLNSGRVDEGLVLLDQVQRLAPERLSTTTTLVLPTALTLAENGDGPAALQAFNALQARDRSLLTAENWNTLCWRGSLFGHAKEVLPACERAVALDPENGGIRDSRGLARALAGDAAGAITDFEAFIRWARDNQFADLVPIRTAWIKMLRAGGNPFDGPTILQLRQQG